MFAIVDIETCGNKYEYKRGRITEICIAIHDGLQVVEKFTSLINPNCYISPFFVNISGITNEMVANAPRFHEIAKKILELTEGKIFVAHNVGFDYSFIRDEFAGLGYTFKRETLCTVRLSRKLMPGKLSYSLGNLCESIGIEVNNRHRAEGDVDATVQLFNRLLELKSINPQYKNKGVDEIMTRRIDKIKHYILNKLPETCGVYYFLNKEQQIIYIGKSVNMYNRALSHFNSKENKSQKMLNDLYNVDFIETGSELIALLLEAEEIKKHKPKYNRMRKAEEFTHAISWFKDERGILNFKLTESNEHENEALHFTSYSSAREKLEQWIEDYHLCLRYCHLTSNASECFNHQIKKCRGICSGEEGINSYNQRAEDILKQIVFPHQNFALIDHGKHHDEKSIILVEKGKFSGFGYINKSDSFYDIEECKSYIKKAVYYPDANDLIRAFIKQNRLKTIVFK
jgi:DNA polymerase-3 subunit epsilon